MAVERPYAKTFSLLPTMGKTRRRRRRRRKQREGNSTTLSPQGKKNRLQQSLVKVFWWVILKRKKKQQQQKQTNKQQQQQKTNWNFYLFPFQVKCSCDELLPHKHFPFIKQYTDFLLDWNTSYSVCAAYCSGKTLTDTKVHVKYFNHMRISLWRLNDFTFEFLSRVFIDLNVEIYFPDLPQPFSFFLSQRKKKKKKKEEGWWWWL